MRQKGLVLIRYCYSSPADIFCPSVLIESSFFVEQAEEQEESERKSKDVDMPHVDAETQAGAESSGDQLQSLPFPPVTYSHILHCSYHYWLPK